MRIVTARHAGAERIGLLRGEIVEFPPSGPSSLLALVEAGPTAWREFARTAGTAAPLASVELLAPIPRPRKNIMCLGWNYADHVQESAGARERQTSLPEHPIVFTKNVTSVTGPYSDIPAHTGVTEQLDWEVELGVVIGIGGRHIARERALRHVFGYTVVNDLSARDLQFRHKQYFLGKSLDGACPMGPIVVTADEIDDPQQLALQSRVNGVVKQSSNTRHMIFPVAEIIHVLSRGMTLEPGDIIATGTPSGVGFARTPPEFLKPGDVVECEIERIGVLRNRITD